MKSISNDVTQEVYSWLVYRDKPMVQEFVDIVPTSSIMSVKCLTISPVYSRVHATLKSNSMEFLLVGKGTIFFFMCIIKFSGKTDHECKLCTRNVLLTQESLSKKHHNL